MSSRLRDVCLVDGYRSQMFTFALLLLWLILLQMRSEPLEGRSIALTAQEAYGEDFKWPLVVLVKCLKHKTGVCTCGDVLVHCYVRLLNVL